MIDIWSDARHSPGLGIVLRVLDLVLGDDVRILVEDEESRGPTMAGISLAFARTFDRGGIAARCSTIEGADKLALLEPGHDYGWCGVVGVGRKGSIDGAPQRGRILVIGRDRRAIGINLLIVRALDAVLRSSGPAIS